MKLILAVVQDIDADPAMKALTEAGERVTRIATTGGFFRQGNTTILCAADDDHVQPAIDILQKICRKRTRAMPVSLEPSEAALAGAYAEVPVGGATMLVFNIERFEQI